MPSPYAQLGIFFGRAISRPPGYGERVAKRPGPGPSSPKRAFGPNKPMKVEGPDPGGFRLVDSRAFGANRSSALSADRSLACGRWIRHSGGRFQKRGRVRARVAGTGWSRRTGRHILRVIRLRRRPELYGFCKRGEEKKKNRGSSTSNPRSWIREGGWRGAGHSAELEEAAVSPSCSGASTTSRGGAREEPVPTMRSTAGAGCVRGAPKVGRASAVAGVIGEARLLYVNTRDE